MNTLWPALEEGYRLSRAGWLMATVSVGSALVLALVVGGSGVRSLVQTFGREVTMNEKLAALNHCRIRMLTVRNAIEFYMFDTGKAPTDFRVLVSRPPGEVNWNGPYIRRGEVPRGPWGRDFRYEPARNGFYLTAAGPDRIFDATELKTLSVEEAERRLSISEGDKDLTAGYDPTRDNVEVFHYHEGMATMVAPGTRLRDDPRPKRTPRPKSVDLLQTYLSDIEDETTFPPWE